MECSSSFNHSYVVHEKYCVSYKTIFDITLQLGFNQIYHSYTVRLASGWELLTSPV